MAWAYEGNEGFVPTRKRANHTPIHRLWKEPHHVYTTSKAEYDRLGRQGYAKERVAGYVARQRFAGHTALYHVVHPKTGDTVFTTRAAERDDRKAAGYTDRGRVGYVARERHDGHQPFYRAYDPARDDHLYSHSVVVIDANGPTLSRDELIAMLKRELRKRLWPRVYRIELGDDRYYCPSLSVARKVVDAAGVAQRTYMEEVFDCDDFAHLLKSAFIEDVYDSGSRALPWAAGIVWGNEPPHAMNFVILSEGPDFELKIVEPQEGTFLEPLRKVLDDIYLIVG